MNALRNHPELAIFLVLAVGFVIGRIRIGSFKVGNVVGTLIAGVLIGQFDIKVDPTVKSVFFSDRGVCISPFLPSSILSSLSISLAVYAAGESISKIAPT